MTLKILDMFTTDTTRLELSSDYSLDIKCLLAFLEAEIFKVIPITKFTSSHPYHRSGLVMLGSSKVFVASVHQRVRTLGLGP